MKQLIFILTLNILFLSKTALSINNPNFIKEFLPENPVIVEAGPNLGNDIIKTAQAWPQGKIHAFETLSNLLEKVKQQIADYSNVTCYSFALSDQIGTENLYIIRNKKTQSSIYSLLKPVDRLCKRARLIIENQQIRIPTITLDEWAQREGINHIDLLCLNLQGMEPYVLAVSPKILKTTKAIWLNINLQEIYESGFPYLQLLEYLQQQGFKTIYEGPQRELHREILCVKSEKEIKESFIHLIRLLIKIPTRSRPSSFFKQLDLYYEKFSGKIPCHFLITCDSDDITMNNKEIITKLDQYPHLTYRFGTNSSKIEAYNKDISEFIDDFDIVVLASDDMEPIAQDYDKIIAKNMFESFPNFDGVLNFYDGGIGGPECNTYPIIGRTFYKRFGYAYYPGYKSFAADKELTLVSKQLKKEKICSTPIFVHRYHKWDSLYAKNTKYNDYDQSLFQQREQKGFFINSIS